MAQEHACPGRTARLQTRPSWSLLDASGRERYSTVVCVDGLPLAGRCVEGVAHRCRQLYAWPCESTVHSEAAICCRSLLLTSSAAFPCASPLQQHEPRTELYVISRARFIKLCPRCPRAAEAHDTWPPSVAAMQRADVGLGGTRAACMREVEVHAASRPLSLCLVFGEGERRSARTRGLTKREGLVMSTFEPGDAVEGALAAVVVAESSQHSPSDSYAHTSSTSRRCSWRLVGVELRAHHPPPLVHAEQGAWMGKRADQADSSQSSGFMAPCWTIGCH